VNRSKFTKGQTMQTYETLKHTTTECKYHVVFIGRKGCMGKSDGNWGRFFGNWRGKKNAT